MGLLDPPPLTKQKADTIYATPATVALRSKRAFASLPLSPIGTMASPPTIVTDAGQAQSNTGTTGTTLAGTSVNLPYNASGKWRFLGGTAGTAGAAYYSNYLFNPAAASIPPMRVDFMYSGQELEIIWRATNGGNSNWRLMVDGQWANDFQVSPGATGLRYFTKVTFPSRKSRRITFQYENLAFGGLNLNVVDTVWQLPQGFRAMFLGDSYTLGTGATRLGSGWAHQCADYLGWIDYIANAQSGTGYLNAPTDRQKFEDRVAATVTPFAPDLIVVMGGYNDNTFNNAAWTTAAVGAAAAALFSALKTALPNTSLIVTSGQASVTTTVGSETYLHSEAILNAAAAASNVIKTIDMTNAAPWITGNGKVGATNGSGNADVLVSSDGAHPSQEGHDFYGVRIAREIRAALLSS